MSFEVAEIAQNLARNRGYYVFPCRIEDKRPATPHGFHDAQVDPDAIARLWRRYPGKLIGVATGERSGIAILDVDIKADEARVWWRKNENRLPGTRTFRTRSGGLHLVFQHAAGLRCIAGKPIAGLDVRADGGYVIWWFAAGFECMDHSSAALWPAWLTEFFWPPPKAKQLSAGGTFTATDVDLDRIIERARSRVRDAADGQKHYRLLSSARLLGGIQSRAGFTDDQAIRWLIDDLPAGVKDEDAAKATAAAGLEHGRASPLLGCR